LRVPAAELPSIRIWHHASEIDPALAAQLRASATDPHVAEMTAAGTTTWLGAWRIHAVTVGWDWAAVRRVVILVNVREIRTNLELTDRQGNLLRPGLARIHLLEWIESLEWREISVRHLLGGEPPL
jgi:hypothetical protein